MTYRLEAKGIECRCRAGPLEECEQGIGSRVLFDFTHNGSFDDIVLEFLRQGSENLDAGDDQNVRDDGKAQLDLTGGNCFGILPAAA